jgi:uncharacterized membrane protein YjfL (UPF0719 family)
MIDAFINTIQAFPRGLVFVALGLVVLALAKLARDLVTHYSIDEEVTQNQNLAVALRLSGYFTGVVLVLLGALYQPLLLVGEGGFGFDLAYWQDVLRVFLYSLAGIVALNLVRPLMEHVILYKFSIEEQIVKGQNIGAGAADFGLYVATGLLIAGAVAGEGVSSEVTTALVTLAFFGMGLAFLVAFSVLYQITTPYDIHSEIEGNNTAVGIAFGGNLIAIGLVMFKAEFGDFVGWGESIAAFLTLGVIGFALLYVLRLLIDLLLLPTIRVSSALGADQNIGVAFVESSVVIASALILFMAI